MKVCYNEYWDWEWLKGADKNWYIRKTQFSVDSGKEEEECLNNKELIYYIIITNLKMYIWW